MQLHGSEKIQLKFKVMKITLKQELKIYEMAFELHLKDLKNTDKTYSMGQEGMCDLLDSAIESIYKTNDFDVCSVLPRFAALKPKTNEFLLFWWSNEAHDTTRKKKFKQLIKEVKNEIKNKQL